MVKEGSSRAESKAPAALSARTEEHAGAAGAYGLVHSPTSDRKDETQLTIDRFESRYKRLRKNVITTARLLLTDAQEGGFRHYLAMLTLTYAPDAEWQPYHITDLQKRVRAWLRYRGYDYRNVWVSELQKRGVPHYHIAIWVPHGVRLPKADAMGWWPHGMTNIEGVSKPIGYLIKYLSKGQDSIHRFPKGMRTHGSGGLSKVAKRERRWWMSPKYVRDRWPSVEADVARAEGGGWVSRESGEWMASPWQMVSFGLGGVVVRWIAGPQIGVFSTGG